MKKALSGLLLLFATLASFAQQADTLKTYRVGIFASLYLDSSFSGNNYKFNSQMPKHILPGLDFVQGALLAVDSIKTTKKLRVDVYDMRSANQSLQSLKNRNTFDSIDLIIAPASGNEYRTLADIALQKNIPFVSATYPNEGGITNNPFTIIVNSTLSVHCEAIYNFIMRNHATSNIVFAGKKGAQEDKIRNYFTTYNKGAKEGSKLLNWKNIVLSETFSESDLSSSLDSEKTNLVICGSLDEAFGVRLVKVLHDMQKQYNFEIVGMPTWEGIKEITKPEYKELTLYHSSTFYNTGTIKWNSFTKTFTDISNGRPSDLAYKGYELSWNFINLLLKYGPALMQNLNDRSYRLFTEYDFKPILNSTTGKPDYFENKKIYILKTNNGLVSRMN